MQPPRQFCCFCDLTLLGWDVLAQHLLDRHGNERVCGRTLRITGAMHYPGGLTVNNVVCWCGMRCGDSWSFGDHLEARGDLEQHLLEIALGITDIKDNRL